MLAALALLAGIGGLSYVIGSQISNLAGDRPQFQDRLHKSQNDIIGWIRSSFHIPRHKQETFMAVRPIKWRPRAVLWWLLRCCCCPRSYSFWPLPFIYTFFFLLYRKLMPFLKSVFQEENKSLVQEIIEWVRYIIGKYITGLLIEMAIVATVVNVVFMLLGAKYAILLGLITGLFNIIPYISIVSALAISSAVTFATAPSQPTVIYVMITLFITYLVDSNVLLPLVVASKVRINTQITVLGSIISELIWDPGAFFCLFRCSRYLNFSLTG